MDPEISNVRITRILSVCSANAPEITTKIGAILCPMYLSKVSRLLVCLVFIFAQAAIAKKPQIIVASEGRNAKYLLSKITLPVCELISRRQKRDIGHDELNSIRK